ncbi:MAG: hypothetical protein ABSG64_02895 [Solirubrobacteraceae bacterium]
MNVPDDDSGQYVFVRPGDQSEGVTVEHSGVAGGSYVADVV